MPKRNGSTSSALILGPARAHNPAPRNPHTDILKPCLRAKHYWYLLMMLQIAPACSSWSIFFGTLVGDGRSTGDAKTEICYLFSIHFGITSAHTKPSPRNPNTDIVTSPTLLIMLHLRYFFWTWLVATKSTGDTETEWYHLFGTHFGIASAHTKPHSNSPQTESP